MSFPFISAEEAASHINHGDNVALSGFTASGTPKKVTKALAERARAFHAEGKPFKINLYTGASTNDFVDGNLTRADAIAQRAPYQGTPVTREAANSGAIHYYDPHLSHMTQDLRYGFIGGIDVAIVEVTEMNPTGEVILGAGLGMTPTIVRMAKKVIIEYSSYYRSSFRGFHDNYVPLDPPHRREIPIYSPTDRIGSPILQIDPDKIIGVVPSNESESVRQFTERTDTTRAIGRNVASFLASEMKRGTIPPGFLPIQSGVGNVANAALYGLAENPDIPQFQMFTEIVQDAVLDLMKEGKCSFASTCGFAFSDETMFSFMDEIDYYRDKLLMRPSEISNNPEIVRRLGLIAMNTALECDIYGFVNSTHVNGTYVMNGIGGAGDFARNAYISMFLCPSIQKGGRISAIVPMVSHVDHTDHCVRVIVTEQGVADLRGKDPMQRANCIIDNCVHPDYRELLRDYIRSSRRGHIYHNLADAFAFHRAFEETGDMRNARFS
ncbi:MAG: succinate CoA transferase [Muribaculaceae bacterium]|nr:succinate CoA transferase [Bacteroides sp.]MDE6227407.1 succinate CoA transferase [Muribaculaceae bacterium]